MRKNYELGRNTPAKRLAFDALTVVVTNSYLIREKQSVKKVGKNIPDFLILIEKTYLATISLVKFPKGSISIWMFPSLVSSFASL